MTEQTQQTRTVQGYRHEAKRVLVEARKALNLRTDGTKDVYVLLNGTIENIIRGVVGLSQEEQVARLSEARDGAAANKEALAEAVATAKAQVQEQIDAWEASFSEALDTAVATLDEAAGFARDRDFAAWQEGKGRKVPSAPVADESDADDDVEDDDLDGDTEV